VKPGSLCPRYSDSYYVTIARCPRYRNSTTGTRPLVSRPARAEPCDEVWSLAQQIQVVAIFSTTSRPAPPAASGRPPTQQ
jgi:hypothetical protein